MEYLHLSDSIRIGGRHCYQAAQKFGTLERLTWVPGGLCLADDHGENTPGVWVRNGVVTVASSATEDGAWIGICFHLTENVERVLLDELR